MTASNTIPPSSPHVVVVGGGLGGLATAARLRRAGFRVTLVERNSQAGGKAGEHRAQGFRWDTGPSLLTLPDVVEELANFLGAAGPPAPPVLKRLKTVCHYFWPDGTTLDADEAFLNRSDVQRFLNHAAGIYALSGEAFLRHPPSEFWRAFHPRNLPKLIHLPKVATFATMSQSLRRHFTDPRLVQLFERFATYNGSDPRLTPATFNVIPYVENAFGAWYPEGGIRRLADWLVEWLIAHDVEVVTSHTVTHYDGKVITAEPSDGLRRGDAARTWHPDAVVCNGEVARSHRSWIKLDGHERIAAKSDAADRSLAGFVLLLGLSRRLDRLGHHNIFFSDDYHNEFDDLFRRRRFPEDPTVYINLTCRTDPADAPPGCDNAFVMVNAPAETEAIDWSARSPEFTTKIFDKLESMGCEGLRDAVVYQRVLTPADFAARDLSSGGALYGAASHGIRPSLFRPPLRSPLHRRLFFVGGSTHPGGGIPLVLLGGRMVSEMLVREFGLSSSTSEVTCQT